MDYLDMCISETLRMFPPGPRVDRVANEDYKYKDLNIPKGTPICISIYAIHHDPEIYPEPEKFKPERFSEEGKKSRDNESYLGFGIGPRNCVAMRFALLEIKLLIAKILSRYQFETCEQTYVYLFIIYSYSDGKSTATLASIDVIIIQL